MLTEITGVSGTINGTSSLFPEYLMRFLRTRLTGGRLTGGRCEYRGMGMNPTRESFRRVECRERNGRSDG